MSRYHIKLTLLTEMLGTVPLNKQMYEDWIASKEGAPPQAMSESETVPEVDEKGKTGFHRDDQGNPMIYTYMIKGFFKEACGMLARAEGTLSSKLKAYKKIIDGLVFVDERTAKLHLSGPVGELQRPLRAQTAQGERIALSFSESVPAGSWLEFHVEVLADKVVTEDLLREWLDYGRRRALGQWRNAGYGTVEYEMKKC